MMFQDKTVFLWLVFNFIFMCSAYTIQNNEPTNTTMVREAGRKIRIQRSSDISSYKNSDKDEDNVNWNEFKPNKKDLDELVKPKSKPKKRLALPASFVMGATSNDAGLVLSKIEPLPVNDDYIVSYQDNSNINSNQDKIDAKSDSDSSDTNNNSEKTTEKDITKETIDTDTSSSQSVEDNSPESPASKEASAENKMVKEEIQEKKEQNQENLEKKDDAKYGKRETHDQAVEESSDEANSDKKTDEEDELLEKQKEEQREKDRKIKEMRLRTVDELKKRHQAELEAVSKPIEYDYMSEYDDTKDNPKVSSFEELTHDSPLDKAFSLAENEAKKSLSETIRFQRRPNDNSLEDSDSNRKPKRRRGKKSKNRKRKQTALLDSSAEATIVKVDGESVATPIVAVAADSIPESTGDQGGHDHDHEHERGGGKEYHAEQGAEQQEEGYKAYQSEHKSEKKEEGHHDKQKHVDKYDESGKHSQEHYDGIDHHGHHHHEEKGQKKAQYEESGKHSKGHSTKGTHDIHKKEEYEKKVEFFEEDGDEGDEEDFGGHKSDREHGLGHIFHKGQHDDHHHSGHHGEHGEFQKGGHSHANKGHKVAEGHDKHGSHLRKGGDTHSQSGDKEWTYHHGSPAKTAHLTRVHKRHGIFMFPPPYLAGY